MEGDLINLKKAAQYTGCYSQDYLSLRARQGKLKAMKIDGVWYTKKEWINDYLNKINIKHRKENRKEELKDGYISLREASKFVDYSQDYLSLRARQGKLQAVKQNGGWVTKKEWLDEYIKGINSWNNGHTQGTGEVLEEVIDEEKEKRDIIMPLYYTACAILIFIILFFGFKYSVFERGVNYLENIAIEERQSMNKDHLLSSIDIVKKEPINIGSIYEIPDAIYSSLKYSTKKMGNDLNKLGRRMVLKAFDLSEDIYGFFEKEKIERVDKGMVIVKSGKNNMRTKEEIQNSFSDEIRIVERGDDFGVIRPVFREREGEDYMYIMVPTN